MHTRPLSETNPYMRDREMRERLIDRSVASSSAVEGIKVDFTKMRKIRIPKRIDKKIYKKIAK